MCDDFKKRIDIREEVPIKSFSVDVFICKIENNTGRYLILKRCSKFLDKSWQMVSGRLEKGETAWGLAKKYYSQEGKVLTGKALASLANLIKKSNPSSKFWSGDKLKIPAPPADMLVFEEEKEPEPSWSTAASSTSPILPGW